MQVSDIAISYSHMSNNVDFADKMLFQGELAIAHDLIGGNHRILHLPNVDNLPAHSVDVVDAVDRKKYSELRYSSDRRKKLL